MSDSNSGLTQEEMMADSLSNLEKQAAVILNLLQSPKAVNLSTESSELLKSSIETLQPLSKTLPDVYSEMQTQSELLKNVPIVNELLKKISVLQNENDRLKMTGDTALAADAKRVTDGINRFATSANMAGEKFNSAAASLRNASGWREALAWVMVLAMAVLTTAIAHSRWADRDAIRVDENTALRAYYMSHCIIFDRDSVATSVKKGNTWKVTIK